MVVKKSNLEKLFLRETKTSLNSLKTARTEYEKALKKFIIKNISGKKNFEDCYKNAYSMVREDSSWNPWSFFSEIDILECAIHARISLIECGDSDDI